jgi:ubiquinone/menaquinone biosynthesis C-methylase UbiE/predicted  nucleic acid-binding Zn-ribbon protein
MEKRQTMRPGRARDLYRRLPAYLYLADLTRGRRILEVGAGDGAAAFHLARGGASSVVAVERQPALVEQARARYRAVNLSFAHADWAAIDLPDRSVDVALCPAGEDALRTPGFLEEMRRVIARAGHLVVLCQSGDRPGVAAGHAYHDLVARLTPIFGGVRMIGVTPFVGFSAVEFSEEEELTELELDTSLTGLGTGRDPVCEYIALAGPIEWAARGYMAIELPGTEGLSAIISARGGGTVDDDARARGDALETELVQARARLVVSEEEIGRVAAQAAHELEEERRAGEAARGRLAALEAERTAAQSERQELAWRAADLEEKVQAREDEIAAMRLESAPLEVIVKAAEAHQTEMEARQEEIAERDAYVEELRGELEEVAQAQAQAAQAAREAETRAAALDAELRDMRSRLARAEGLLLKGSTPPPPGLPPGTDARVGEIEAALAEKTRQAEKYQQNWKDAEAKSDDLWRKIGDLQRELVAGREQGVETARQQRHAAQVALTRAVDEASKKLVSVQDMLMRTERERADLERQAGELKAKLPELAAALSEAEGRASAAEEETSASRALAAKEIGRLREELAATRARAQHGKSPELDRVLAALEEEIRAEEARIGEIEGRLTALAAEPTSYS